MYLSDNALVQDVKRQVLTELRQDRGRDQVYKTIKDSVKNEVLAEFEAQQMNRTAELYGLDRSLSDRRLQGMIDDRYRAIDNMKADIKKDLQVLQREGRVGDPHIREAAGVLASEAYRRGIPHDQLVAGLDRKTGTGAYVMDRISEMLSIGQRRGVLYGLGGALMCYLLIPSLRNNMRSIVVRSVEEGMSMVDRAKGFVGGQQEQGQTQDFASYDPESSPLNNQPPNGCNPNQ